MSEDNIDTALNAPWESFSNHSYRRRHRRTTRVDERYCDLGDLNLPDHLLVLYSPFGADSEIDVVVNQMTVQDIISCERTSSQSTEINILDRLTFCIKPGNRPNPMRTRVNLHLMRFSRIRNCDLEAVLRAKASESPSLDLEQVSMLLNPSIPTVLLPRFRTLNAIADWSTVQGNQGSPSVGYRTNPSENWVEHR